MKFWKKRDCGCIVVTIVCEKQDSKIFLGGHKHHFICDECKYKEKQGDDTLHEMWLTDNVIDDFEYAGWKPGIP